MTRCIFLLTETAHKELYSIDIESGKVFQHTSLPYGGDEFCFIGQDVIFSMLTKDGRLLHKASALETAGKEVDFNDIHQYRVADKLTMQERASAAQKCIPWADSAKDYKTTFSKPERYRKPLNILRFHSWAPLYFNYDRVRNLSGDLTYETASAGATALFQNSLGTAWGSVGYSFHKDPFAGVTRTAAISTAIQAISCLHTADYIQCSSSLPTSMTMPPFSIPGCLPRPAAMSRNKSWDSSGQAVVPGFR